MVKFNLTDALKQIELEKGLAVDTIIDALKDALLTAYKKNYEGGLDSKIVIDEDTGEVMVFEKRENESGELEEVEATPDNFGRIAAQTAKQVIIQRIREAEREMMFDEYHGREGDIVTGIVQQGDQRYTLVDLGKVEALLPPSEQVRGERYDHGTRIKTYIVDVRKTTKGPQIMVSRTHPGLLKRLFELEVPEIYEGLVEIKAVAREAGQRSKVAVATNDPNVDPVGACVGAKGSRVRMIVGELRGEKVDIVEWKENPAEFVANAISPARVSEVIVEPEKLTAEVIVPDNQLSLAIGKEGQNARLAAKLTGWRIDILSETQSREIEADRFTEEAEVEEGEEKQCRAITSSGKRCKNKAKPGSDFCGMVAHQKMAEMIEAGCEVVEVRDEGQEANEPHSDDSDKATAMVEDAKPEVDALETGSEGEPSSDEVEVEVEELDGKDLSKVDEASGVETPADSKIDVGETGGQDEPEGGPASNADEEHAVAEVDADTE